MLQDDKFPDDNQASRAQPQTGAAPNTTTPAVARGFLSAAASRRGRPRPVNDMWIAACCFAYEAPLATLNLKDYDDFTEHHGLRILGTE